MSYDNSLNFTLGIHLGYNNDNYTFQALNTTIFGEIKGAGGGGSDTSTGGNGSYIFFKLTNLIVTREYKIIATVGEGGYYNGRGGKSYGSTYGKENGGNGISELSSISCGGGGGMSSLFIMDTVKNEIVCNIVVGGGGGGGINNNGNDAGYIYNSNGNYRGNDYIFNHGLGGNNDLNGNGGISDEYSGNYGYDISINSIKDSYDIYINDLSGNEELQTVNLYMGGGGGSCGSFNGGGGGAGYGGGGGGNYGGGGGGGGSFASVFISVINNDGGAGGIPGENGENGSIYLFYNNFVDIENFPIVNNFMLNTHHSCKSEFNSVVNMPYIDIDSTPTIFTNTSDNIIQKTYGITIDNGYYYYFISESGILTSHYDSLAKFFDFSEPDVSFVGVPIVTLSNIIVVSATTTKETDPNHLYGIIPFQESQSKYSAQIVWRKQLDSNCSGSPLYYDILNIQEDLIKHYFLISTEGGYIYNYKDMDEIYDASQNISINIDLMWKYKNSDNLKINNTLSFDKTNNILAYTTYNSINDTARIYILNLSEIIIDDSNNNATFNSNNEKYIEIDNDKFNTPSIDILNKTIFLTTEKGNIHIYKYNTDNTILELSLDPTTIITTNETNISNIAIGTDYYYFTTSNSFYVINKINNELLFKYFIGPSDNISNSTPTIDVNNNVLFGAKNNRIYSYYHNNDKSFNWTYNVEHPISSTPVIDNLFNITVTSNDGYIIKLSNNKNFVETIYMPIIQSYMLNNKHTGKTDYTASSIKPVVLWKNPIETTEYKYISSNFYLLPHVSILYNNHICFGSYDGNVYIYNPVNHYHSRINLEINRYKDYQSIYTTPLISNDGKTIYVCSYNGILHAISIEDPTSTNINGTLKWSYNLNNKISASPIIDLSNNIYVCAGSNLYSIKDNGYTGFPVWLEPFKASSMIYSSPVIVNNYIYIASLDGMVYEINTVTGPSVNNTEKKFNTNPGSNIHQHIYTSPTIDEDNNIIISSSTKNTGKLYYIDFSSTTPSLIWGTTHTQSPQPVFDENIGHFYNTTSVNDKTIYLSTTSYIYAINRSDGRIQWKFHKSHYYYTTPLIDSSNNLLFSSLHARTNNGNLHYLKNIYENLSTSEKDEIDNIYSNATSDVERMKVDYKYKFKEIWNIEVSQNKGRLSQPILGTDGTIFVTSTDNNIYAIK